MKYRKLGNTGVYVSEITYGTMFLGGAQFQATDNPVTREEGLKCLQRAKDVGINYIDSADIYGAYGPAERIIGEFLVNEERADFFISSKAFVPMNTKPNNRGLSKKHIKESVDASLIRFQTDYIDLFYAHRPDYSTPIEEVVRGMNAMIEEGKILYWGTSNWRPELIEHAIGVANNLGLEGPVADQSKYNLYTRYAMESGLSYTLSTHGLSAVPYKILADGVFAGIYTSTTFEDLDEAKLKILTGSKRKPGIEFSEDDFANLKRFQELAESLDINMAQLSYAWTLHQEHVSTAIMSTRNPNRIDENILAVDITLSDDLLQEIDTLFPIDPYLELAFNSTSFSKFKKFMSSENNTKGLYPPDPSIF